MVYPTPLQLTVKKKWKIVYIICLHHKTGTISHIIINESRKVERLKGEKTAEDKFFHIKPLKHF
jgi:hypothetical protein